MTLANPNTQPIFIRRPAWHGVKLAGTEVVSRSPTVEIPALLVTGVDPGCLKETIQVMALGVQVKSSLRFYWSDPILTQGKYWLFHEVALPAVTAAPADDILTTSPSGGYPLTVTLPKILSPASPDTTKPNQALRVPGGAEIRIGLGTAVASGYTVIAMGGDYA